MRLPDPLQSRVGRLTAFFALYLTEGIPLGFTATAIATQMRRQGLGPEAIGAFVASLYLPWAFKWAVGPFVDVISSERFGRRRTWIVLAQVFMVITLMVALPVNFTADLKLFTAIILLHNVFSATQDVAIDALAVNVLREDERGLANGLMFGGAYLGQAVGGSGVLFLAPVVGFANTYWFVAGCILVVTLLIALPMREPRSPAPLAGPGSALARATRDIGRFVAESYRSFTSSRAAWMGVIHALLPGGAYALGLALQSNLAVELGLNDTQFGLLNLWSTVISALGCVAGGWISDRFGRRRTLALFIACTTLPTFWLALRMQEAHWIMPVPTNLPNRPVPSPALLASFWGAVIVYNVFQGLYYGIRSALFMDVTNPRVAATQFTAYMALMNVAISYSARWQGWAVERWGYPMTLVADSVLGLLCLATLPFMGGVRKEKTAPAGAAVPEAIEP